MILCIGTTPAAQRVMVFPAMAIDAVNRAATTLDGAAGKSVNVAKVLKALGEQPLAVGFLGGDRGEELRSILAAREIEHQFVQVSPRTRQCITVVDQSAGTHTELVEDSKPVTPRDYESLLGIVREQIPRCRAVIMSGSVAPGGPADFYLQCLLFAKQAGVMSVVDTQGNALLQTLQAKPGVVKPNRAELASTLGRPLSDEASAVEAMRELVERGAQRAVATAGKQPALAFDGKSVWRILAPRIEALNPIGSGDAFTAGLVYRLLRGDDLGEACRWAAAAGAANALTLMAGEVERATVERLAGDVRVARL